MSRLVIGLLVVLVVAGVVLSRGMGFTSRRAPRRSSPRWRDPRFDGHPSAIARPPIP
jgi:hypothetical protein